MKPLAWGESLPLSSGRTHATEQSCPVGVSKENMGFGGLGGWPEARRQAHWAGPFLLLRVGAYILPL